MVAEETRWTGNRRAVLMQLWISAEPEHLASRISTALEISGEVVKYHLRRLEAGGYVARRPGDQAPLPQFTQKPLPDFNGLCRRSGSGFLSAADLWSITEEGKAKAEALAAEKEG